MLTAVFAAPQFPALTGRVVDGANLLSAATRAELTALFAQHEKQTSNQVVVATLAGLQGYDIADFGVQLGRYWKVGQAERNNGVLLIVAPRERKVRIEIGYGLEGVLTDALGRDIIESQILPHFRRGDYEAGIRAGAKAILGAIAGSYQATRKLDERGNRRALFAVLWIAILLPLLLMLGGWWRPARGTGRGTVRARGAWGGRVGGGFSGGGGSFGGGGASGSW